MRMICLFSSCHSHVGVLSKSIEMNCLAAAAGVVLVLFGPVRTILGALVAVGFFCLLIKGADFPDAMTKYGERAHQAAASEP